MSPEKQNAANVVVWFLKVGGYFALMYTIARAFESGGQLVRSSKERRGRALDSVGGVVLVGGLSALFLLAIADMANRWKVQTGAARLILYIVVLFVATAILKPIVGMFSKNVKNTNIREAAGEFFGAGAFFSLSIGGYDWLLRHTLGWAVAPFLQTITPANLFFELMRLNYQP